MKQVLHNGFPSKEEQPIRNFYDDSKQSLIKKNILSFKEMVQDLPDEIYIDAIEEFSEYIDLQELNNLLELDTFSKSQEERLFELIKLFKDVVVSILRDYIDEVNR